MPEIDQFPDDTLKEYVLGEDANQIKSSDKPIEDKYIKRQPTGFFPDTKSASNLSVPIPDDCFIPNSVLAKLLWPTREKTYIKEEEPWKPPTLSDAQLRQLKVL